MAKVRVWNDNQYEYSEELNGDKIFIPPGKFIVMDTREAEYFLGKMPRNALKLDAYGNQDPRSFKMLRIERISNKQDPLYVDLVCNLCNFVAPTKTALTAHSKEHGEENAKTREMLKAENLDTDEEVKPKRRPGRAPKKKGTEDVSQELQD